MIGFINNLFMCVKIIIIRARPYPPSLSRMAARIIDPATGASTWAFGNHKCTENNGNFTKNAVIIISQIIGADLVVVLTCSGIVIFRCLHSLYIFRIIISKGKDAVIVYTIKYILACSRSG